MRQKNKYQIYSAKQSGFTLIELLLSVGLVIFITSASFILYKNASQKRNAKDDAELIANIIAEVKSIYPNGDYSRLESSNLLGGNSIPKELQVAGTDLSHISNNNILSNKYGASIEVYPVNNQGNRVSSGAGNSPFFAVSYWGLEPKTCLAIVSILGSSVDMIFVNSETQSVTGNHIILNKFSRKEFNPNNAVISCKGSENKKARVIVVSR